MLTPRSLVLTTGRLATVLSSLRIFGWYSDAGFTVEVKASSLLWKFFAQLNSFRD